jgi:hypothetical protein
MARRQLGREYRLTVASRSIQLTSGRAGTACARPAYFSTLNTRSAPLICPASVRIVQ